MGKILIMEKILGIFCAGSFGKEVYDIAQRINDVEHKWKEIVFVDNYSENKMFYGVTVYRLDDWSQNKEAIQFVIATGEPGTREVIYNQLKESGYELTSIIDPTVIVSPTAKMGEGVIITPFSTVSSDVTIDDNVLIQSYVRIGHDIVVGKHSVVSANVGIGGVTKLKENVFIGLGANVKGELNIGKGAIVSMGAVVYRDIDDNVTVAGNPARETKRNDTGKVFG